jgi:hypothetical protein
LILINDARQAERKLARMKRPSRVQRYIAENVFGRCGQAVSKLAESGLLARPAMPESETEIHEWWLVSPRAARELDALGQPVVQFCELYMWGRTQAPGPLEDDPALARVLARGEPAAASG